MSGESSIRLLLSGELSFGPGKAELLEKIGTTGSVQAAAAEMGMSYMKAWKIVKGLNERFREPLVALHRGGREKGGAELTDAGREVLALYREAVLAAAVASGPALAGMRRLLTGNE